MCFEKNRKFWTQEEETLLKDLYETYGPKNWKKISKQLKKHGFKRKQIQVREKWINHMDPDISNSDWNHEELQILYKAFNKIGSKWCLIKKQIPGRTQIKIKNKFYSNVRVYIRFVVMYFKGKNCRNKQLINRIPPNVLNQIYNGQKRFQFFKDEFQSILTQMDFKIDKILLQKRIQDRAQVYKQFSMQMDEVMQQILYQNQCKKILQNNESFYSDEESQSSIKKRATKTKIGTTNAFRMINDVSESNMTVKKEQESIDAEKDFKLRNKSKPRWSSVIVIQPRNQQFEPMYYCPVYFPWQMLKIQEHQFC